VIRAFNADLPYNQFVQEQVAGDLLPKPRLHPTAKFNESIIGTGFWFARGALVVGLAIPTSIIGTFLILGMLGRSLNVISLAGLAFAVGMLVDNAVVVLENIYRRWDNGEPPFTAAVRGTTEVWGAVLSSTLTTIAVFLPIVFVEEEAGQLFRDIAMAITAAVGLSMVISMTLIPMAAARLFGGQRAHGTPAANSHNATSVKPIRQHGLADLLQRSGEQFVAAVVGFNAWIQRSMLRKAAIVLGIVGISLGLSWWLFPRVEYLPTGNRNLVFGILLPPPGYNLDELMQLGETVEEGLRPYWDVEEGSPEAQALEFPVIGDFFFVARGRQVFMGLRAREPERVAGLVPLVQKVGKNLPGTFAIAKQSSLFEQGLAAGRTINVEITGPDLDDLVKLGGRVLGDTMKVFETAQARPIPSLEVRSNPELHVEPKLIQAAQMGVNSADLGYTINAFIDGAYATDYFLQGDKIDLVIIGKTDALSSSQGVRGLPIATPSGALIPVEALADVTITGGPDQVNHRERERAITIEISPPPEVALEDAMSRIQAEIIQPLIDNGQLGPGYRINLAGTADKLRDTWTAL
ncbi:MAG: efflux RND transporter permease subunit, partial [Aureliella sp.]